MDLKSSGSESQEESEKMQIDEEDTQFLGFANKKERKFSDSDESSVQGYAASKK